MGEYIISNGELYHYGIKGMKWGIRRFQNPDGTLTSEGRKRARQEYREDNRKAFEYGREATILNRASRMANKSAERRQKQFDRNPTERRKKNLILDKKTAEILNVQYRKAIDRAKSHEKELMEKYGKEAVKNIKYDKKGNINERVNSKSDWGLAIGTTLASAGLSTMMGLPFYIIASPPSKNSLAAWKRLDVYKGVKKEKLVDTRTTPIIDIKPPKGWEGA